jgi:hypothetical protein
MPKIGQTVYVPFRLRDDDGAFVLDANLANYDILLLRDGATFVPASPSILTPGSSLGRHLYTFESTTEAQYNMFIDHNAANRHVSIEGMWSFIDQLLTSDLPTAADVEAAIWDAATADHLTAGTFGALLNRMAQLCEPEIEVDRSVPSAPKIILKDKDTAAVLLTYTVGGILDTRVTDMDPDP